MDKMGLILSLGVVMALSMVTFEDIMFYIERGNVFSSMSVNKPKPRQSIDVQPFKIWVLGNIGIPNEILFPSFWADSRLDLITSEFRNWEFRNFQFTQIYIFPRLQSLP